LTSCIARFLERHAKPNKRSWREDERLLRHDVLRTIGDLRIDAVTRRDIVVMLDAIRDDEVRQLWSATAPGSRASSRQRGWRSGCCS
jgi:hypothetical protein